MNNTIDASMLANMMIAGAENLKQKSEWINELNVFPVPDGDTGTNMTMTIASAVKEIKRLDELTIAGISKAIAFGSLRGARGNSGVILSQIFRGFTKGIRDLDEIDAIHLANAFQKGVETAYKAVMKPKEGTILTVAKAVADKASELAVKEGSDDLSEFMSVILAHGEFVLSQTPEMLPVLKEAGVVDAGGQGLIEVLRGAFDCFQGKEVSSTIEHDEDEEKLSSAKNKEEDIKFGYCTEFIVLTEENISDKKEQEFKSFLSSIGDSIVMVSDEGIIKVHVHTNDPGLALQKGLTFGQLTSVKIDNMREEHYERVIKPAQDLESTGVNEEKEVAFISVSIGEGFDEIFKGLGVDCIIKGGQTMNPSTEDLLNAIQTLNAKVIYILPNNKNIILAANQAKNMTDDKEVIVIPTQTIPQGITAMINYVPSKNIEDNTAQILEEIKNVKTGQITYAVRNTTIDGKEIAQGNIMGIGDSDLLLVGTDIEKITIELIEEMVDDDSEIISIYYGSDIDCEMAEQLVKKLEEKFTDCEIELNFGGQPIYYYVISVE